MTVSPAQFTPTDYLTAALVLLTAVYAWLTYLIARSNTQMLDQVRKQIEAQTRPVVSVNIETRHQTVFSIRISNRGNSPAQDVRISIDRPFFQFGETGDRRDISKFALFSEPIPTIAAGDGYLIDLAQGFNLNKKVGEDNISPDRFAIRVNYRYGDINYDEKFHIDLRHYFQTHGRTTIVEQLEHIKKTLDKIYH